MTAQTLSPPDTILEQARWLTSPDAARWLNLAAESTDDVTTLAKHLRRDLSAEQTHLVLEQVPLRKRAREKFAAADAMFFTAKGLEQATDEIVADYKSRRFAEARRVFDLCTGIGGDLLALAGKSETVGFDRDPFCAELAAANARLLPRSAGAVEVRAADVAEADLSQCDAWHIDPDRRPQGKRTTRASGYEPSADGVDRLLAVNPHAAIKVAPAAELPRRWTEKAELEWISRGGQCRQLVAWFGRLAGEGSSHRATVLGSEGAARSLAGIPGDEVPVAREIARYVYEPDAAVLAAKLTAALAAEHAFAAVAPGVPYWTASQQIDDPMLACFEVEEVLPLDVKKLKALVRDADLGSLEIKVRGVDVDPADLRKRLRPTGERPATLLLFRGPQRAHAL
ncbi:MAG: SAM-dependent methyltransferase, partial [Planctomycetota bacterium]